jgi:hypothetical protein
MLPKVMIGLDKRAAADLVPTAQERASAIATIVGSQSSIDGRVIQLSSDREYRDRLRAVFCLAEMNGRLNSLVDPKIIHPVPRIQLRGQPARLLTAAGPSLGWSRRILEFRKNLRVRSTGAVNVSAISF